MNFTSDSYTADGKTGDEFAISLMDSVMKAGMNQQGRGGEAPWVTVGNYLINLERRVKQLEDDAKR